MHVETRGEERKRILKRLNQEMWSARMRCMKADLRCVWFTLEVAWVRFVAFCFGVRLPDL